MCALRALGVRSEFSTGRGQTLARKQAEPCVDQVVLGSLDAPWPTSGFPDPGRVIDAE